ncbi:RNA polymerase sigma factor [Tessaracoccus sp. MC1865]|uniref:RNA polymerase sigma factor n=1 Tax=Tessaracoccus sp. MC1865 TaxID=2760310 RepID=UPI001602C9B1|nr:RNA polymerase sigma factor [Tessaracoccus sp. MC1865]MBB1483430.1 RNA polymerase sigma factor [Tessaracoccus sp. MC1865]QTO36532.1 RNA polymerase sigma factor [Tessaracoccus sp. MC1865]
MAQVTVDFRGDNMTITSVGDIAARTFAIDAARAGDERAFGALLEPHRHTLWSVCLRITNDPRDAMDALAHTFGNARRAITDYSGAVAFGQWLSLVAAGTSRAVAWHRQRSPEPLRQAALPVPVCTDPVELRLRGVVESLPVVIREALVLRDMCGLTYEQIAVHQVVGIHTVKARLSRGGGIRPLQGAPALDRTRFDQLLRAVLVRHRLAVAGALQPSVSR